MGWLRMSEPLMTFEGEVLGEWTDYNGHLRDAFYLLIFSYGTDGFMDLIGLDERARESSGHSLFTLECHLNFLHEVKQGERVEVRTQVLGHDHKRVHLYHALYRHADDTELAASEQMLLHVDLAGPRSAPFGDDSLKALRNIVEAQLQLPKPAWVKRVMALS